MNANEILIDLARRPQQAAEMLREELTPELLNAHPHHDNSIAWLLWHAAREIDEQLAALSGETTVWVREGFDRRFGLDLQPGEIGYGHSAEQARAIIVHDPALLLEHLASVVDAQLTYISACTEDDLSRIVDERWDPPVTLGARLVSLSVDAVEHVAQAAYVVGMGAAAFEAGDGR